MLTPRQVEIARMVARGMSYKAIAREQDISIRTVVQHVQDAACRINGLVNAHRPRDRVTLFILTIHDRAA
jgi:FixJ family two-component response regulator